MLTSAIICYVLLSLVHTSSECNLPNYNLSISTLQDENGDWYAKVKLDHNKDYPLEFSTIHKSEASKCSEEILIVASKRVLTTQEKEILHPHNQTDEESYLLFPKNKSSTSSNLSELSNGEQSHSEILQQELVRNFKDKELSNTSMIKDEYTMIPGLGYYKVNKEMETWSDAKKKCEKDGAHLLVLNSAQEVLELEPLVALTGTKGQWHWVGIHDLNHQGHYMTVLNSNLESTGYNTWWTGYPTRYDGYDCVLLYYYSESQNGLADNPCEGLFAFICEKDINN